MSNQSAAGNADIMQPSANYFDVDYLENVGVERPRDCVFIVLHHSAGRAATDLPYLTRKRSEPGGGSVSAHRYVTRTGQGYRLLDDKVAAWACGVAPEHEVRPARLGRRWAANENYPTLQIEMENLGPPEPFMPAQYTKVVTWCVEWITAYGIPADRHNILGHRELTTHPWHRDPHDKWNWESFMSSLHTALQQKSYQDWYIVGAPTISREQFRAVLSAAPPSPVAAEADRCFDICRAHEVNPAVALAFFRKESSRGTTEIAGHTRNWGNLRRAHDRARQAGTYQSQWGAFAIYRNWQAGLEDWCELLRSDLYEGEGRTTVRSVLPKYAPATENRTAQYIQQAVTWIAEWQQVLGNGDPIPQTPRNGPGNVPYAI